MRQIIETDWHREPGGRGPRYTFQPDECYSKGWSKIIGRLISGSPKISCYLFKEAILCILSFSHYLQSVTYFVLNFCVSKNLFWVDRISISFHSAFSSCISCLLAWTSCCLMYAGCAFARPVCSDFWRPCLISRLYFCTYSSAADFRPIDVVIDSDGFIIPAKADQEFQWLCSLGENGGEGEGRRSERLYLKHLSRCDHFTEEKTRRGMSAALFFLFHK